MEFTKYILTENDCYKAGRRIKPLGIMVHSTGANNTYLRRYINPDDGYLGVNLNNNHWNQGGVNKCVHAMIGRDKNKDIKIYQTLPWDWRGWHAGGLANNTHISFEILEDDLTSQVYFLNVYNKAVELCAFLCKEYGILPANVIGHYEGAKMGIASNHADPAHWFVKFGKSMDIFRKEVAEKLNQVEEDEMTKTPIYMEGVLYEGLLIEGKTYVVLRPFAEALKCKVNYQGSVDAGTIVIPPTPVACDNKAQKVLDEFIAALDAVYNQEGQ